MMIFIIFTFLSLFSILGYGILFANFTFKNSVNINIGLIGFFGFFFLTFISYLTHFFVPHNYLHNSLIIFLGLFFFIYFLVNKKIKIQNINFFILLILIIGIFIGKSHDDFPYYHLPNALHFTEQKLEFGLGNLNHGFKHHSSIFYLYSIFYLPFIQYYLFNVLNFFFLLFTVWYLFNEIICDLNEREIKKNFLIKLLFLIFIVSIFNRVGEYGTDITGQLLAAVIICLTLDTILKKNIDINDFLKINIFLLYLITIKTYFIFYIFLPLILFYFSDQKFLIIKKFFFSKIIIFLTIYLSMFFLINISATGCIIYPVSKLCFPNFFYWGLPIKTVEYLSNWYEIWSKAGAGPDFRITDPLIYKQNFNWIQNWFDRYFFTKVSDFLSSIFIGLLIVCVFLKKNLNFQLNLFKKKLFLFFLFALFVYWFLKFPSLRYGGYIIILSIISILLSSLYDLKIVNQIKFKKKIFILVFLAFFIFFSKNLLRLNKEFNYNAINNFKSFPLFFVENVEYNKIFLNDEKAFIVKGMCWATPSPCIRSNNFRIQKKFGYKVYLKN